MNMLEARIILRCRNTIQAKEVWLVLSGCKVCGKSQEEVEKEFKRRGII
ncbi:MAG: hypothetical protein QXS37_02660 [Candidatus Aenigmatarchaeota archaeon]